MKAFDIFQARKLRFELASAQVLKSRTSNDVLESCCGLVPGSLAICQNCDLFERFMESVNVEMEKLESLSLETLLERQQRHAN